MHIKNFIFSLMCISAICSLGSPIHDDLAAKGIEYIGQEQVVPIEYLKGDGHSWIFIPHEVSKYYAYAPTVELKFICPCSRPVSPVFNMYYGSRGFCVGRDSSVQSFHVRFGNLTPYKRNSGYDDVHILEFSPSEKYVVEDGVEYELTSNNLNESIDTFCLFARYNSRTKVVDGINDSSVFWMRIYSPDKSEILFDLQPVRIGNEGFLYDQVSGLLFGNSGTGSFILGPDL